MLTAWRHSLAAILLLGAATAEAAVNGCGGTTGIYTPYGQWTDLPATLDGLSDYVPITHWPDYADPMVINETTAATDVTIILMHGKNGTPWFTNQVTLANELAALGFKVVAPTMPWGRKLYYTLNAERTAWIQHSYFAWDGDMCQAMNYIEALVAQERAIGRRVLLMGHSMGGRHALIYGHLNTGDDIAGLITSAPGSLIPLARRAMDETAASRQKAANLVLAGHGDTLDTFQTLNTGGLQTITTTANIYLTYHDPDPDALPDGQHSPDISNVLANVAEPVLWLVGVDDALRVFYESNDLFGKLTGNDSNLYQVLPGDHLSVLFNESAPIHQWFTRWSTINPADRDADGTADVDDAFPDNPAAATDTDGDGQPDAWNTGCAEDCQAGSGLTLDLDDDNDGMTDVYEIENGLDPRVDDAALDRDGDGYSNLVEFKAGTAAGDPADSPAHALFVLDLLQFLLNEE